MPKVYFIGPLAAIALFAVIFLNFKSGYREREEARVAEVAAAKEAKLKAEVDARRQAIEAALVVQEERKKEREANEAHERAEKESRQLALDAREAAYREQEKLTRQLDRIRKELAAGKDALAKLEAVKSASLAEQVFLRDFVQKAEGSVKTFEAVLAQIESADRARSATVASDAAKKKS